MATAAADDTTTDTTGAGDTKPAGDDKTADSTASAAADTTAAAAATAAADSTPDDQATKGDKATTKTGDAQADPYASLAVPKDSPLGTDDTYLAGVKTFAKAQGYTPEQTAALIQRDHDATVNALGQLQEQWDDLRNDPVLGGTDANFDKTQRLAQDGLREFFGADEAAAKEILNTFRFGNNKVLVRAFARHGQRIAEDSPGAPALRDKPPERKETKDLMFPSSSSGAKE